MRRPAAMVRHVMRWADASFPWTRIMTPEWGCWAVHDVVRSCGTLHVRCAGRFCYLGTSFGVKPVRPSLEVVLD